MIFRFPVKKTSYLNQERNMHTVDQQPWIKTTWICSKQICGLMLWEDNRGWPFFSLEEVLYHGIWNMDQKWQFKIKMFLTNTQLLTSQDVKDWRYEGLMDWSHESLDGLRLSTFSANFHFKNLFVRIFHNICVFTVFLINKCSLREHKRHLSKNLTGPKLLNNCVWINMKNGSHILWNIGKKIISSWITEAIALKSFWSAQEDKL